MCFEGENNYEYRILCALRRVIRAVDVYSRKLNSAFGITTPQLLCLYELAKSKDMTLTDLAKAVSLGLSTVNGIVDRLAAKQYLTRKRSEEDHRKVYLELSSLGRDIALKAPPLLQDKLSASLSQLSESELLTITKSLERVVELMKVEEGAVSPNLFSGENITKNG